MRRTKVILISIMALILVTLPLLGACGEKEVIKEVEVTKVVEVTKEVEVTKVVEVTKEVPVMKGEPIKISQEFGLTGPYGPEHKHLFRAYQDYIRYINEEKGGLPDTEGVLHPVELLWGDMKMSVPTGISLYDNAKQQGAMVHGTVWVAATVGLRPKADKDKFPLACLSASYSAIEPHGYGYVVLPYYEDKIGGYVDWFLETQWKGDTKPKLAIIGIDNPFGRTAVQPVVLDYIESRGVEVVSKQFVDLIPVDTSPNLAKIRDADADFMWCMVVSPTAAVIARDMVKMGFDIPRAGPGPMGPKSLLTMGGEATDGWISFSWVPFLGNAPGIELARELQLKYHEEVHEEDMYSLGMTCCMTMVEAARLMLEEVPFDEITPQKMWEYGVNRINGFETGGLVPPITLGVESGYYGQNSIRPVQITGGELVFADDWIALPDIMGYEDYYETEGRALAKKQIGQ